MVDHVVRVVTDHLAVVDLAGDHAADTRRLLGLDADTSLAVVVVVVLLLLVALVLLFIIII
jgi:hypothetical protein